MPIATISGKRETGRAYREVIHPALDPHNYPQFNIIKDVLFDKEDPLLDYPPVYGAGSIGEMKGFRSAQVDTVIAKAPEMKRLFKHPEILLGKFPSAIFIIPDVTHYPAFDPEHDEVFFGKLKELSNSMSLSDNESEKITAKPYKDDTYSIWPNVSEFEDAIANSRMFNERRWEYWKGTVWKHDVVILATREVETPKPGIPINAENLIINEKYQLIDILAGGYGKGERQKKKDFARERLKKMIPSKDPQGI